MSIDGKIHMNITITGRVQGVGFRFAARNMAMILSIKGSIKNLINGNVYIEAEGNLAQLSRFIDWCTKGPTYADVENVFTEEANLVDYKYFDIV